MKESNSVDGPEVLNKSILLSIWSSDWQDRSVTKTNVGDMRTLEIKAPNIDVLFLCFCHEMILRKVWIMVYGLYPLIGLLQLFFQSLWNFYPIES